LPLGQSYYEAITNKKADDYFKGSLATGKVPSGETLRLRLDEVARSLRPLADACPTGFLKNLSPLSIPLDTGNVHLDCDIFPSDNCNTQNSAFPVPINVFSKIMRLSGFILESYQNAIAKK
jgi:hypothetical protein